MNYTEAQKRSEAELERMLAFFKAASRNLSERDEKAYRAGWRASFSSVYSMTVRGLELELAIQKGGE